MDKFLLAPRLLHLLQEGRFFRQAIGWILRIEAVLAALRSASTTLRQQVA